jgi:hypothetical protein
MFIQFLITFSAILLALILLEFSKGFFTREKTEFKLPSPSDVVYLDLNKYLDHTHKVLDRDFKGDSFPVCIPFPPQQNSWTRQREAREIVCGPLQNQGWVVIPTDDPNFIKLDLPRIEQPKPAQ